MKITAHVVKVSVILSHRLIGWGEIRRGVTIKLEKK